VYGRVFTEPLPGNALTCHNVLNEDPSTHNAVQDYLLGAAVQSVVKVSAYRRRYATVSKNEL
jgi:hypothetical protein